MVGVLAVLSLALLSVYFRESPDGPLHDVQGVGATAIRPFQVGAERVARPFRDLYGWFDGLLTAKEESERLRAERDAALRQAIENQTAAQDAVDLKQALDYQDVPALRDFRPINTRVLGPQSPFGQRIVIAAGSEDGVVLHAPVLVTGTLVGYVTQVTPATSLVTLLTDESSAVAAYAVRSNAHGLVESGEGGSLAFNEVGKEKDVVVGDIVATSGSPDRRLPSLFPRGIPIGVVTSVSQTDTEVSKVVQLQSTVDLSSLNVVTVFVR